MPLSVYVHVPFCLSRCHYCAFYSGEPLDLLPQYPGWLADETRLRACASSSFTGPAATVYFGGGTPSLLGPSGVGHVLDAVARHWGIETGAEVSLEANPAAAIDLAGFRSAGVTRLSLGAQCLDDDLLRLLGRTHTAGDALRCLRAAVSAGFRSVSADLLFAVPGVEPADLRQWARELVAAGANHLSTYSLEIHPRTPLDERRRRGSFLPPSPEEEEGQWSGLDEELQALGFAPYEVSNYCVPGHACLHNLAYWTGLPYLGLGPGAHSFLPGKSLGTRYWNLPGLPAYAAKVSSGGLPPAEHEVLSPRDSLLETLFLALRRPEPIAFGDLCSRYGLDEALLARRLDRATADGLLARDPSSRALTPSRQGLRTADGLALWLLEAIEPALSPRHPIP